MRKQRILIAGGYGRAGLECARMLRELRAPVELCLAGRNLERARAAARALERELPGEAPRAMALDLADGAALRAALVEQDLLLVASSTIPLAAAVARACLETDTDYYDLQISSPEKLAALRGLAPEIQRAGRCFVTEGGFHPGLLAPLVRLAAGRLDHLHRARIHGALHLDWSNMGVGAQTMDEFVLEFKDYDARIWREGRWQQPSLWRLPRFDFGPPIGPAGVAPMCFPEIEALTETLPELAELGFWIAGFNPVLDYLVMPLVWAGLKVLPPERCHPLARLFLWGTRFSRPPYLARLVADFEGQIEGEAQALRISVEHSDGYRLTAAPVAATLLQLLGDGSREPGLHLQGLLVEPERFFEDLQRQGIDIRVQ